ncbi:MAG: 30S ribosomal protein S4 [bacterium]|nr:30S ribosomal protein S4 [bacterium]
MRLKQYKTARRLGARIFSKTQNPKFVLTKHMKLRKHPSPMTEFGLQFLEKQKMRYSYNLSERQFGNYVKSAMTKSGVDPGVYLYSILELRLDNVLYRLGLAKTRPLARQLVSHGHIVVNKKKVTISSCKLREGDLIQIRGGSREKKVFADLTESLKTHTSPSWLSFDMNTMEGKVIGIPKLEKFSEGLFNISEVIGFYSR